MSASVALVLSVLVATGVLVVFGRLVHRDLTQIADHLARSGHPPDLGRYIDQVRSEARSLHQQHAQAVDARFRDVEAAVTDTQTKNAHLGRYVGWMAPLVEHWARAEGR